MKYRSEAARAHSSSLFLSLVSLQLKDSSTKYLETSMKYKMASVSY